MMFFSRLQLGIAVIAAAAIATALVLVVRQNLRLRADIARQSQSTSGEATQLLRQVAAAKQRLVDAEEKVNTHLKTARDARTAQVNLGTRPVINTDSAEAVKAVTTRALQLIKEGKEQSALDEYVSCYREVRQLKPGSSECQRLMSAIKHLARTYPAALVALRELRDGVMTQLSSSPANRDLMFEIALLNERLGEGHRTLALYDSLPPDDRTRGSLAMVALASFIAARRYNDALLGRNFGQMLNWLEGGSKLLTSQDSSRHEAIRKSVIDSTATHIEVLTGAGKVDEARVLTEKLLAFDNSLATQTTLRQHVDRANAAK